jgi:hypothetical protein
MEEGRKRKRLTAQLLEGHPYCCFCGGGVAATTADHVPAKIMFWGKRRPKGLEVPACKSCNNGTKALEQLCSIFARVSIADERTPEERAELSQICTAVSRAFPGWQRELFPDSEQIRKIEAQFAEVPGDVKMARIGPLVQDAIYNVGAKLGFALHYHLTGLSVPATGCIEVRYETNHSLQSRELPPELLAELGPPEMLKQGEWTTFGHFAYRPAWIADGSGSMFLCHLGKALLFILFVVSNAEMLPSTSKAMRRVHPGDLQRADANARAHLIPLPTVSRTGGAANGRLGWDLAGTFTTGTV